MAGRCCSEPRGPAAERAARSQARAGCHQLRPHPLAADEARAAAETTASPPPPMSCFVFRTQRADKILSTGTSYVGGSQGLAVWSSREYATNCFTKVDEVSRCPLCAAKGEVGQRRDMKPRLEDAHRVAPLDPSRRDRQTE